MKEITLRIPKRENSDAYQLELYEWTEGQRNAAPSITERLASQRVEQLEINDMQDALQAGNDPKKPFSSYGQALYDILHRGRVGAQWDTHRAGGELRTYLCLEDEMLSSIPWELLHESGRPFAHRVNMPIVRCHTLELQPEQWVIYWPLRVLVLVGAGPQSDIGVEEELRRLKPLFRANDHVFDFELVHAESQDLTQSGDMLGVLESFQPDVFHFIGHAGRTGPHWDQSWLEIYNRKTGLSWHWLASDIAVALENAKVHLRWAYLNACRTGTGALDLYSIASAFLEKSSLAVIAMQADVDAKAARSCALKFYERLAKGDSIDQALQRGRYEMPAQERDSYLPVLVVKAPVDSILPAQWLDKSVEQRLEKYQPLIPVLKSFVNRHSERREVIAGFFRSDTDLHYRAAYVCGPSDMGKTWLGWWLLQACARQKIRALYVVPQDGVDWLDLLRAICHGSDDSKQVTVVPELPAARVAQFYFELDCLAKGTPGPFRDVPTGYVPESGKLSGILSSGKAVSGFDAEVMASFRNMLRTVANPRPLLLIFDHFRGSHKSFSDESFQALKRGLFDPIADDSDGLLRLLLILPADARDQFEDVQFSHRWLKIDLNGFKSTEMPALVLELFERGFPNRNPPLFPVDESVLNKIWTAREVHANAMVLSQFKFPPPPPRGQP